MVYFVLAVSVLGQAVQNGALLELTGEAAKVEFGGALTLIHNSSEDELVCSGKIRASDVVIEGTTTTVADLISKVGSLESDVAALKQFVGMMPPPASSAPGAPPSSPPPCTPNPALFNGAGQYYTLTPSDLIGGSSGLTIAAWVRRDEIRSWDRVVDFNNGQADNVVLAFGFPQADSSLYGICLQGSSSCRAGIRNGEVHAPDFPTSTWTHLAVVHSTDGTATLYYNGIAQSAASGLPFNSRVVRANYYVGKSPYPADASFKGAMRDLVVFNAALNITELDLLRNQETLPVDKPLIASFAGDCLVHP